MALEVRHVSVQLNLHTSLQLRVSPKHSSLIYRPPGGDDRLYLLSTKTLQPCEWNSLGLLDAKLRLYSLTEVSNVEASKAVHG